MDDQYKKALEASGADVASTLKRFMGNEAIYQKFLNRFLDDQNYSNLMRYLEEKNYGEAFKCAHTLKGVAANMGLIPIQKAASDITELLRGKQPEEVDVQAVEEIAGQAEEAYRTFSEIIKENQ